MAPLVFGPGSQLIDHVFDNAYQFNDVQKYPLKYEGELNGISLGAMLSHLSLLLISQIIGTGAVLMIGGPLVAVVLPLIAVGAILGAVHSALWPSLPVGFCLIIHMIAVPCAVLCWQFRYLPPTARSKGSDEATELQETTSSSKTEEKQEEVAQHSPPPPSVQGTGSMDSPLCFVSAGVVLAYVFIDPWAAGYVYVAMMSSYFTTYGLHVLLSSKRWMQDAEDETVAETQRSVHTLYRNQWVLTHRRLPVILVLVAIVRYAYITLLECCVPRL